MLVELVGFAILGAVAINKASEIKESLPGLVLAAGSEGKARKWQEYIQENGKDYAASAIVDDVCMSVKHKGTEEDPFSEVDLMTITTALSVFKENYIYDGRTRLIEELDSRGCNVKELERL